MPPLMKNFGLKEGTVKVECQVGTYFRWPKGVERWLYTERVNGGCFVIIIANKEACMFHHLGELPPNGHNLYERSEGLTGNKIQKAWFKEVVKKVTKQYQEHKHRLQGAHLYMVCPVNLKAGSSNEWYEKSTMKDLKNAIGYQTGLLRRSINVYVRHDDTPRKTVTGEENYSVVEICYEGNENDPLVYLNAQPMLFENTRAPQIGGEDVGE